MKTLILVLFLCNLICIIGNVIQKDYFNAIVFTGYMGFITLVVDLYWHKMKWTRL